MVHHYEVGLHREGAGLTEAFRIVAYEEALEVHLPGVRILREHGLDVNDGKLRDEVLSGIFEHLAHRASRTSHQAFHSVGGADEVALVDAFAATYSHEDVLGVVRHSNHLVRHNLAYRKDEVEGRVQQELVHLRGPVVVEFPFGDFFDVGSRHAAYGHDVVAPVVHAEFVQGSVAVHGLDLLLGHGSMGAEGRHHIGEGIPEIIIYHLGDGPRVGVEAGEIRRNRQHALLRAHGVEYLLQRGAHLFGGDGVGLGSSCVVQHGSISLLVHFPARRSRPALRRRAGRSR